MKRKKIKLEDSKLEEIVIEQNAKIKKLTDQVNALRSQKVALKQLLAQPIRDSHWVHTNLLRVEREMKSLRSVVDNKRKSYQELEDKIKEIENKEIQSEQQLSLFEIVN